MEGSLLQHAAAARAKTPVDSGPPQICYSPSPAASSNVACTHRATGPVDEREQPRRVGNRQSAVHTPRKCKVEGCCSVLRHVSDLKLGTQHTTGASRYSWRLRVCDHHRRAALVPWADGEPKRWCQARSRQCRLFPSHHRADGLR